MKARLIKDARIHHKAGDIVEVSPAEFNYLASTKQAVLFVEEQTAEEEPKKKTRKKAEV
jgi:hypothetical protein